MGRALVNEQSLTAKVTQAGAETAPTALASCPGELQNLS